MLTRKSCLKLFQANFKAILLTSIFSQQSAYVKNRFIEESGRLISDIIEISDWFNIEGLFAVIKLTRNKRYRTK